MLLKLRPHFAAFHTVCAELHFVCFSYSAAIMQSVIVLSCCGTELESCNLSVTYLVCHVIINPCFALSKCVKRFLVDLATRM